MIRPKTPRMVALILMGLALSGCIQPVHTPQIGAPSRASAALAEVSVDRIEGFIGFNLQSELDFLLTGGQAPKRGGRYLLKIQTQQTRATSIIDRQTSRAEIATLQVEAVYVLVDQLEKGKIKASGKTFASASFDRSQLRFATLRAQRDAEERVAKQLAERLKIIIMTALLEAGPAAGADQFPELSTPIDPEIAPVSEPGSET